MYCENCGIQLGETEKFCKECGYRILRNATEQSTGTNTKRPKRYILIICLIILGFISLATLLFIVFDCKHEWIEATCSAPKTCSLCEKTEGTPLGHKWIAATCEIPKTCKNCSSLSGEALGHNWTEATTEKPKTCKACGKTEGSPLSVDFEDSISYIGVKSIIRDTLSDYNPWFEYDSGILHVHLYAPEGTVMALLLSMDEIADSWESLIESLCSISNDAVECFSLDGYDVSCSLMLHSDLDTEKIILGIYNGIIIFNIADEIG